jgi:hypothetical protein
VLNQNNSKDEQDTIIKLQEIAEYLLRNKEQTEIFKIILTLLRNHFPNDIKLPIDLEQLVQMKILSYLLKTSINTKHENNIQIKCNDILTEINDLFIKNPPSNLQKGIPNCQLYLNLYTLLKCLTDDIINDDKENAKCFVNDLKSGKGNKSACNEYVQYLENYINKIK